MWEGDGPGCGVDVGRRWACVELGKRQTIDMGMDMGLGRIYFCLLCYALIPIPCLLHLHVQCRHW